mgnify:CR=1 FL=1|nr:MAG TPA: hypothetical protein [Caudoviricetes sp.]
MIDLRNTCVLVRTPEENEKLLNEAKKQGFQWDSKDDCKPLPEQCFPDILRFYDSKVITQRVYVNENCNCYEASELLNTKEMTTREFAEHIADMANCCGRECSECVLNETNTKCGKTLCNTCNWKDNIDELLEIAKSGRITVPTPEEKMMSTIEKFIENPDRAELNDEFVDALKLAVEKLKEVK